MVLLQKKMSIVRVTKEFRFEGAHALNGYDGKCRHIHGHSYRLFVTIKGEPIDNPISPKDGMVMDFSDLKSIVNRIIIEPFDHALILREGASLAEELSNEYCNVKITNFQPTCENLAAHFAELLKGALPANISLECVKLYETATSYVEWRSDENN